MISAYMNGIWMLCSSTWKMLILRLSFFSDSFDRSDFNSCIISCEKIPFMPSNICWKNQFWIKKEFWEKSAPQLLDCQIFRSRITMSTITQMLLRWVNLRLVLLVKEKRDGDNSLKCTKNMFRHQDWLS